MYPTVSADELREIAELIEVPGEDGVEFRALVNMLIGASKNALGYTAHTLLCAECGNVQLAISPVPQIFPTLCYECGETACYIYKTAGEE